MARRKASIGKRILLAFAIVGSGLFTLSLPVAGGIYFFYFRGTEVGRVAVGDAPAELVLSLPASTEVTFWTEIDVTMRLRQRRGQTMSDLPHVVDYAIEVEQNGAVVARLRCNPFQSTLTDWSRRGGTRTTTRWRYVGRVDDCTFRVPTAGPVTVRVQRAWLRPGAAEFATSELIARR